MDTSDCAIVVETENEVKVHIAIPKAYHDVSVDEVENGILVHAQDTDTIHCFVPLPKNIEIHEMRAQFVDSVLQLTIPKA